MYPKEFFEGAPARQELGRCFVLMPFATEFDVVYEAIREVVGGDAIGFTCKRADELFGGGHIIEDILTEIARAEVVIADVSMRNPNVFYELGIVHMVKDTERVLILSQSMADVPFDILQFRSVSYSLDDLSSLQNQLLAAFSAIAKESFQMTGAAGERLESPRRLLGPDRWMYSLLIPELYAVEPDFAKFLLQVTRTAINRAPEVVFEDGVALEVGESMELPGARWDLTLTRIQDGLATFRLTRGGAPGDHGGGPALSGTQRKLLAAIAGAGSEGIYVFRLVEAKHGLDLDRDEIVYRAKDLAAQGYVSIHRLTDILYTVTDEGRAALE